jgi:ABC-type amino acid transport substrate-binding protein
MAKSFLRLLGLALALFIHSALADDLQDIRARGVLRHLGIPYANFVTGSGDGLDVEIVQRFARHLGVRYEFVESTWPTVLSDLTGKEYSFKPSIRETGSRPVRGDIVATGLTILPARKQIIDYSDPTFPSAVWLLARADSGITPITPSGNLERDIKATKAVMKRGATFVADNSCLDPTLYGLEGKGLKLKRFILGAGNVNEVVPAMLKNESDMTLLDVPDVLLAMERWSGRVIVVGPISGEQRMAAGFRKDSPKLREAFNSFLAGIKKDGTYMKLVRKYFRGAPRYMPEFFVDIPGRD